MVAGSETKNVCSIYNYQNIPSYFKFNRKWSYKPYNQQTVLYIKTHVVQSVHTPLLTLSTLPSWVQGPWADWKCSHYTITQEQMVFPLHQNTNCKTNDSFLWWFYLSLIFALNLTLKILHSIIIFLITLFSGVPKDFAYEMSASLPSPSSQPCCQRSLLLYTGTHWTVPDIWYLSYLKAIVM